MSVNVAHGARASCAAALALALLATLVAAPALAQNLNPGVQLTVPDPDVPLGAGNSTTLEATVRNTGSLAGAVTLEASQAEGWTVSFSPSTVTVPAGGSQPIQVTLTAPAAGMGLERGSLTLKATLSESQTGRAATSETTLALTRVDPPLPVPPPPEEGVDPLLVAGLALLGIAVIAGGALFYVQRKRRAEREAAAAAEKERLEHEAFLARETGISIATAAGPIPYGQRRETLYRLHVTNETDRPRVAVIEVKSVAPGWRVGLSLPKLALSPKQSALVTVHLEPDNGLPGGAMAQFVIAARPEEAAERDERVTLTLLTPDPRSPAPGLKPTATARQGASSYLGLLR